MYWTQIGNLCFWSIDVKIVFLGAEIFELFDISHMRPPKTFHTPQGMKIKNFSKKTITIFFHVNLHP